MAIVRITVSHVGDTRLDLVMDQDPDPGVDPVTGDPRPRGFTIIEMILVNNSDREAVAHVTHTGGGDRVIRGRGQETRVLPVLLRHDAPGLSFGLRTSFHP